MGLEPTISCVTGRRLNSSRLWGHIKHISLARTHMPDASADCAFLPQLSQSLNDTQTFSAVIHLFWVTFHSRVRTQLFISLSHFQVIYRLWLPKTSLLFVTLHVSITLYEVCRVFLSSRWLTIHHTPGRIRTHTAQILSLLSPAIGLLEQNHHRGSRTPSFWFVAKCFIH